MCLCWESCLFVTSDMKKNVFVCTDNFWPLCDFVNWLRFYQDSLFGGQEKDGWNEDWAMRRMVGPI